MKLAVIVGADPRSLTNFRGDLVRSIVRRGWSVTTMAAAGSPKDIAAIEALGARFQSYPVERNGRDPCADLRTYFALLGAFHRANPDLVLAYTIKPVIWSGVALRRQRKCKYVALIPGLGYAFGGSQSLQRRAISAIATVLYRFALRRAMAVIFQNHESRDEFVARGIVLTTKCHVVAGSGVNIDEFSAVPLPTGAPAFLMIARLLGAKGISEYAAAAEKVKALYPEVMFHIVGPADPSPDAVPLSKVQSWHDSGTVCYHGAASDVRPFLAACHVFVFPSYYPEGVPRSVLEAMAVGRPILTTNVPGCRETVEVGVNGYLVPAADSEALAERMLWFIENREQWGRMGAASRRLAEQRFDVRKVNADMMRIMGLDEDGGRVG